MTLECNDPRLKSWLPVAKDSDFPIQNLPFGVFRTATSSPRPGVAIGEHVLDLRAVAGLGLFRDVDARLDDAFSAPNLNAFLALGRPVWRAARARISELLREGNTTLREQKVAIETLLPRMAEVTSCLPIAVKSYVDFYSSEEHATNVGKMVRDPNNPLLPNWKHIPIGYNGRASSVVVSGVDFHRPMGQIKLPNEEAPLFAPSKSLDFEVEVGSIVGKETRLGEWVTPEQAEEHIFGLVLLNDWSARDIQTWEYVPLGPFNAKSFCTSISPWVVTLDALAPLRTQGPAQNPPVLPYLRFEGLKSFDLNLEAWLKGRGSADEIRICATNFKHMYFNMHQQLAHMTSNGAPLEIGDLYGSGTVSGKTPDSFGSMLEITWRGTQPVSLPDGTLRGFLGDGDTLTLRGYGVHDGVRIGFGEVKATVLPALQRS
jgi:fumarylacetoacetase